MTRCAYIFLDESGNLDFSESGTRYFLLTSVSMRRPFPAFNALDDYKHDCLEGGRNLEHFHCSRDREEVRNSLFDLIAAHLDGIRIDYLVVEKSRTDPALRETVRFYPEMLGQLLKIVLPRELDTDTSEVIVITDAIPVNKKRQAVEKAVRTTLARMLPTRMNYRILHHQSRSHYGLQVADYCCWAVFRKWQREENAWYDRIKPAVCNEFDILHGGIKCWSRWTAGPKKRPPRLLLSGECSPGTLVIGGDL